MWSVCGPGATEWTTKYMLVCTNRYICIHMNMENGLTLLPHLIDRGERHFLWHARPHYWESKKQIGISSFPDKYGIILHKASLFISKAIFSIRTCYIHPADDDQLAGKSTICWNHAYTQCIIPVLGCILHVHRLLQCYIIVNTFSMLCRTSKNNLHKGRVINKKRNLTVCQVNIQFEYPAYIHHRSKRVHGKLYAYALDWKKTCSHANFQVQ